MTKQELLDTIQSQINRYESIYEQALHFMDIEDRHLYTAIEDAGEFGLELVEDFCEKESISPDA